MNLREFVKQSLLDITNGVSDAQEQTKLYIAPGVVENEKVKSPSEVQFEVNVTVSTDGGAAIKVLSVLDVRGSAGSSQASRLTFSVPVYFQAPTERNARHHSHTELKSKSGTPQP